MMRVNFCGYMYPQLGGNWGVAYRDLAKAFQELGYTDLRTSRLLQWETTFEEIEDSSEDVYVYNHTHLRQLVENGFHLGKKTLIMKPTGPAPNYFTIDELGYAACSTITYNKPDFESINEIEFFLSTVPSLIEKKENKWSDRKDLGLSIDKVKTPEEHILVLGQMPGDETVRDMSFGNHWDKLEGIVKALSAYKEKLVIKLHPTLKSESSSKAWIFYSAAIKKWQNNGHVVFFEKENLHEILPNTRVAIIENSTAGIECLLHQVPIISYGYPEYHWITKDLRHLTCLIDYVEDLSWWDRSLANKWLAWYCTQYQCFDYKSTLNRIQYLMEDI